MWKQAMVEQLTRRTFVAIVVATAGLAAAGCGRAQRKEPASPQPNDASAADRQPAQAAAMTVYRDPGCGCCEQWAALAEQAGYKVSLVDRTDMPAIKRRYGVPDQLAACHTAIIGNYVVEGHVPFADIARLLRHKPRDVRGIAVPGMPVGSPGMEAPGAAKQPFKVMAFDSSGGVREFV